MNIESNKTGVSFSQKASVKVSISPEQLADMFWLMGSEQQAVFFNRLGNVNGGRMAVQLQGVTDSSFLDESGRVFMSMIGDYSGAG